MESKNIFLTGFMGVGKTTIAQKLSEELKWQWVDLDREIESYLKMPIPEIFKKKGEIFFRETESKLFQNIIKSKKMIVSLGGGIILNQKNRDLLHLSKSWIYLSASLSTLTKRLERERKNRPLLQDCENENQLEEKIKNLLNHRKFFYEQAPIHINTEGLDVMQITNEILFKLGELM